MNYLFNIALKYLFGIRHKNVANIITLISLIGVLFGTMAMVVVLSVFNGFDDIINKLYNTIDTDFKIELKDGKLFDVNNDFIDKIQGVEGVVSWSEIIEYKMLVESSGQELVVVDVKGVGHNYRDVNNLEEIIWKGNYFENQKNHIIIGNQLSNLLGVDLLDYDNPLKLSFFKEKMNGFGLKNIDQMTRAFYVSGVFQTYTEFDNTYVILDIDDLRDFLFLEHECSSIEIKIDYSKKYTMIEKELTYLLGDKFLIKNRFNQRPFIYKMVKTEKLAVYIIFSFILIVSMLSLIASLVVLLMEKQQDIYTLYSFGLSKSKIKNIFFLIGVIVTVLGGFIGTALGRLVCYLQDKFEIIQLGTSSSFLQAYPVKVYFLDILMIQLIVFFLGALTSYLVSRNEQFYNY